MKNSIIIKWLILLNSFFVVGQNQNNHWQLGTSDVNFSTNPPNVVSTANSGQYGNASISDSNGNLLFYTNGSQIWNKNHQVMQNSSGLFLLAPQAEQPALIIPYPGNSNRFYIFFERSDNLIGNDSMDLHTYDYVLVDFTNNPLGELLVLPPSTGYTLPLTGLLPNSFGETQIRGDLSRQGGLTCAKTNNGDSYWLIVNGRENNSDQHQLYAFNITSSGLNTTPVISNFSSSATFEAKRMVLKISPNNSLLGLLESSDYLGSNSKFYTFNFNSATGQFTNQTTINVSGTDTFPANTFEFSNDSQKVYFAKSGLMVKDLTTPGVLARSITTPSLPVVQYTYNMWHMQRDKYNNILMIGNGLNYISKIDNQDSFSSSSLSTNYATLNNIIPLNDSSYQIKYSLPQSVQVLSGPCPGTLLITTNVISGSDYKQASGSIEAYNTIENGASAIYHAPLVRLNSTFTAKNGSIVHIYTDGCTGSFIAKQNTSEISSEVKPDTSLKGKGLLYPNPNNGSFEISIKDFIDFQNSAITINVIDINGRIIYSEDIRISNETTIPVSLQEINDGMYFVKILGNGHTETLKFIKRK